MRRLLFSVAFCATLIAGHIHAATATYQPVDAAQLQLALRKLTVVGSAMYIAAHPDDENTAMLAWLSNERLYRTGYLSCTRGDGGQNLIGDEKGELLGVIRTQELLAARRIDNAEQMFTRAIDFGFSKNPMETLNIWGYDTVLGDVVWNIRRFQPDVLITRFPTTGEGGHGHHTASAILAGDAFKAAGDPTRFPDQLRYVGVWQPRRIFWNRFSFQPIKPDDPTVAKSLRVDLGAFNELLGRAYTEIAAESRSQHKSQGFGVAERRGTTLNYFDQLNGDGAAKDLFEGIDTTWSRYPGGEALGRLLNQASEQFDPRNPPKSIPVLLQAYDELERINARGGEWSRHPWLDVKRKELLEAIRACAGLAIDVAAADSSVVPGGELKVSVTVINRSDYPFQLTTIGSRMANPSKGVGEVLKNNVPIKTDLSMKVPADQGYSQPYWLAGPPKGGAYSVPDQSLVGLPENPPALSLIVTLQDEGMHSLMYVVPVVYRWTDPVRGEIVRTVDVVPEISANLASRVYIFPESTAKPMSVFLQSFVGATEATVRIKTPAGWEVTPASAKVTFAAKGDEARPIFSVTPPKEKSDGKVYAEVELPNGKKNTWGLTEIEYPHIPPQRVFGDAAAKVVRDDIKRRGRSIGYIMGSGDEVGEALKQVGYEVSLLTDADLERGDFSRFDAIVAGVRAYNTRKRLRFAQARLMEYVKNGGTYVVQYNVNNGLVLDQLGPYPFKVSNDRVTVEEAPVTLLAPDHPLLNTPNKITADDFKGWVQERGIYFTTDADPQYQTILSSHDPGEPERPGGLLFARYGKGVYIYTGYAWFRQLPAGVAGAYKLFVNLVSAK
ncbi:MAG: PIG-L family deacetylase [Acidobacteria bacterium]|nr:PIG-L family deacetylase [Acidobacteriota bacterium]